MGKLHIRIFPLQVFHDFPPQHGHFQHVGLVNRAQLLAPLLGRLKGNPANTPNLGLGVLVGVVALALTAFEFTHAARLTKIDTTGQLAHDQNIQP